MTTIQGIQTSSLPNGAHFNFMEEVHLALNADEAARTRLAQLFTDFAAALATEDQALKVSQKSLLTDNITQADTDRDRLLSLLKSLVKTWKDHPDEAIAADARILAQSLADYGINPSMQLDKESGLLTNLIDDWQTKLKTHVEALHLADTVTKLKEKNELVKSLVAQRADEYTQRYTHNLRAARLATDNAYRALVRRINAYQEIGADEVFEAFAAHINMRITGYKQQVLHQPASVRTGGTTTTTKPAKPVTPPAADPDEQK